MAKKISKAQGRKRLKEIHAKMFKLLGAGYVSMKDFDSVNKIIEFRTRQLK